MKRMFIITICIFIFGLVVNAQKAEKPKFKFTKPKFKGLFVSANAATKIDKTFAADEHG